MSCSSELLSIEPGRGLGSAEAGRGCSADRSAPPRPARSACSACTKLRQRHRDASSPARTRVEHALTLYAHAPPDSTHILGRFVPHLTTRPRTTACALVLLSVLKLLPVAGKLRHPYPSYAAFLISVLVLGMLNTLSKKLP